MRCSCAYRRVISRQGGCVLFEHLSQDVFRVVFPVRGGGNPTGGWDADHNVLWLLRRSATADCFSISARS